MNHEYYMSKAIDQAIKAFNNNEVPIGCVIVKDDEIISYGYNHKEKDNNSLNHAEIIAIKKALKKLNSKYLDDCDLYVTIEPCMMCAGAIVNSRIKTVIYGASNIKGGCINSSINLLKVKGINHKPKIISDVLNEDCSLLIREYFKNKRNK